MKEVPGKPVDREPSAEQMRVALYFIECCLKNDVSFELEFETGRYIPGEVSLRYSNPDDIPADEIIQGRQGFRVTVGSYSYTDENDEQMLYGDLGTAAMSGLRLLNQVLKDKGKS